MFMLYSATPVQEILFFLTPQKKEISFYWKKGQTSYEVHKKYACSLLDFKIILNSLKINDVIIIYKILNLSFIIKYPNVAFGTLFNKITNNPYYHLEKLSLFKLLIMAYCSIWYATSRNTLFTDGITHGSNLLMINASGKKNLIFLTEYFIGTINKSIGNMNVSKAFTSTNYL